jgi:hypothetical protein
MKLRATRGREPDERLRWTKAAINLASVTKCLDIFCDLVDWCKRFLRDQVRTIVSPAIQIINYL